MADGDRSHSVPKDDNRSQKGSPAGKSPSSQPSSSTPPVQPHPRGTKNPRRPSQGASISKLPPLEYDPAEYQLVRHLLRQCPRGPHDVYLTLKTAFKAQMQRCKKLLETPGCQAITLHGLGAATNRAVNLGLQLQSEYEGLLQLHTTTGSLEVTHDLEPLRDDLDPISQTRFISAIHIKLYFVKTLEDIKRKRT